MKRGSGIDVFLVQVIENLHMQRPTLPLIAGVQINCDLHCHRTWHFTREPPDKAPFLAARCRRARNRRTGPTYADDAADSPRGACLAFSELARMLDCV